MHDLITQYKPPYPPAAIGPLNDPTLTIVPTITNVWGVEVEPFYTHGIDVSVVNIDETLRGLIMRCLADQPAHRPTLEELNEYMDIFESHPGRQNYTIERDWFRWIYNEPTTVRNTLLSYTPPRRTLRPLTRYQFANSRLQISAATLRRPQPQEMPLHQTAEATKIQPLRRPQTLQAMGGQLEETWEFPLGHPRPQEEQGHKTRGLHRHQALQIMEEEPEGTWDLSRGHPLPQEAQ